MKNEGACRSTKVVGMCVQFAFIIAGSIHAVYYKTLKHALGIEAVGDMATIRYMYPVVKLMLDEMCEVTKQEMKDKKRTTSAHGNVPSLLLMVHGKRVDGTAKMPHSPSETI